MNIRKSIVTAALVLLSTLSASAQFEKGKVYMGASLSGLDMSYNGSEKGKFSIEGKVGYMLEESLMLTAQAAYSKQDKVPFFISLGVGGRYYIVQNGMYFGLSAHYLHNDDFSDFQPSVQVGYAFFVSRTVTIEPELYYNQSFKKHSDYSTIGLRLGVGVYLFKD